MPACFPALFVAPEGWSASWRTPWTLSVTATVTPVTFAFHRTRGRVSHAQACCAHGARYLPRILRQLRRGARDRQGHVWTDGTLKGCRASCCAGAPEMQPMWVGNDVQRDQHKDSTQEGP